MFDEIIFIEPFLDGTIQREFGSWENSTCRGIEDAFASGRPLAVIGQRTDRRTLLLKIMAKWLESKDQLVYEVKKMTPTLRGFMSAMLTSVCEQLELDDFASMDGVLSQHDTSPSSYTVEEYLEVIQELLEEYDKHLFIFIDSIEELFINFRMHEAYCFNNLVETCVEGPNIRIHFTYALDKESGFWSQTNEAVPLKISHVVRMVNKGEKEQGRSGFSSHGLRRLQ